MSKFNIEWTPDAVLNKYAYHGIIECDDVVKLVTLAVKLEYLIAYLKDDYPKVYADLVLKEIL